MRKNSTAAVSRISRQNTSKFPNGLFGAGRSTNFLNNSGYFSDSKSIRTTGGGLANRLTTALSRVAWNAKSGQYTLPPFAEIDTEEEFKQDDDEDLLELQSLIEEFNSLSDLTVKYNSQLKVCKIIEANDDYAYGPMTKKQGQ